MIKPVYGEHVAALFVEGSFAHGRPLYRHPEDGEFYIDYSIPETFHVVLHTEYGREWVHEKAFDTEAAAQRFCDRVDRALREGKQVNLEAHWIAGRTIYGTRAYLDEEPMIVAREKEDALWNEFFR